MIKPLVITVGNEINLFKKRSALFGFCFIVLDAAMRFNSHGVVFECYTQEKNAENNCCLQEILRESANVDDFHFR